MALSTATVAGVGLADDAAGSALSASTTTTGTGGVGMGAAAAPGGFGAAVATAAPTELVAGGSGLTAAAGRGSSPRLHGGVSSAATGPGVCIGMPVAFPGGVPLAVDVGAAMPLATGAVAGGSGGLDRNDQRLAIKAFKAAGSPAGAGGPSAGGASSPGAVIATRANNAGKAKRMAARHGRDLCRGASGLSLFQRLQQT